MPGVALAAAVVGSDGGAGTAAELLQPEPSGFPRAAVSPR